MSKLSLPKALQISITALTLTVLLSLVSFLSTLPAHPIGAAPLCGLLTNPLWSPNVKANDDTGTARQWLPTIAVDTPGNACAIWQDERSGEWMMDIYSARRSAHGNWEQNRKVNDDPGTAWQLSPSIAIDASGNTYAVWADTRNGDLEIYFTYCPAGGSWGPNQKVNDDGGTAHQEWPAIAVDASGNAYAVWVDRRNGNPDIYFAHRPVGGSWQPNEKVNDTSGTVDKERPDIAVDAYGNAYAVWVDKRNGNRDVYFDYCPSGRNWGPDQKVNDDSGTADQEWPAIAVDAYGNIYVVWADQRNRNEDIYFAYRPAGENWRPNAKVNDDWGTASQQIPDIAVRPCGIAYTVWMDKRNGNEDIYSSLWLGTGWGVNEKVNDDSGSAAQNWPSIAVDGSGDAYAVWADLRNGNEDVFFAYRHRPLIHLYLPLILKNF